MQVSGIPEFVSWRTETARRFFLTDDGARISLWNKQTTKSAAVDLKLVGAVSNVPRGERALETKSNFFLGSDPARWKTNVASYAQVRVQDPRGVDVVWHGGAHGLEYDLDVRGGVDARNLAIEIDGADSIDVDADGSLSIGTSAGALVQHPPRVFQNDRELPRALCAIQRKFGAICDRRLPRERAAADRSRAFVFDLPRRNVERRKRMESQSMRAAMLTSRAARRPPTTRPSVRFKTRTPVP